MTVTLRPATPDDAETLGALHVATWHETYTGMVPDAVLAAMSVSERTLAWRRTLTMPDESGCISVVVAEDGPQVVGFGSCGVQRHARFVEDGFPAEFRGIYVLRSHQGHGAGRAMMVALSRALVSRGLDAATLWVLHANDPARAFYERLGGTVVGERVDIQPGGPLVEDAYGWRDLLRLLR